MSKRKLTSPETIARGFQRMRSALAEGHVASGETMLARYRWLHALATDPNSAPEVHITGDISKPTEAMALDRTREVARYALARAARCEEVARKALDEFDVAVSALLPRPAKPTPGIKADRPEKYHRAITTQELEVALEAQRRRLENGQGWSVDGEALERQRRMGA